MVLVEAQAAGLICTVSNTVAKEADLTGSSVFLPIDSTAPWAEAVKKLYCSLSLLLCFLSYIPAFLLLLPTEQ